MEWRINHEKRKVCSCLYDKIGNGFTETEPWIFDGFDDISQSRIEANRLIRSWCKNVTMFKICGQPPECITWSYVKKHEI